jgi:predicted  nucleic acid-binding Zn-ribbon protein
MAKQGVKVRTGDMEQRIRAMEQRIRAMEQRIRAMEQRLAAPSLTQRKYNGKTPSTKRLTIYIQAHNF